MSYYAYDINGYVGDVASIGGWSEVVNTLSLSGRTALQSLAYHGYTVDMDDAAQDLTEMLDNHRSSKTPLESSVEMSLVNLVSLLRQAKGTLIVNDGTKEEVGERQFTEEEDFAEWDEIGHPRHPAGTEQGGEFAPKGQVPAALAQRLEEARKQEYHTLLFHGTNANEPFGLPQAPAHEDFMLDRMLGAHFATDPELANKFAVGIAWRMGDVNQGPGRVMPFVVKGKGLGVEQLQYEHGGYESD